MHVAACNNERQSYSDRKSRSRYSRRSDSSERRWAWRKTCTVSTTAMHLHVHVPSAEDQSRTNQFNNSLTESPVMTVTQLRFKALAKLRAEEMENERIRFELLMKQRLDRSMYYLLECERQTRGDLVKAGAVESVMRYDRVKMSFEMWVA